MEVLFYLFLFILGACLGSFLCCQARRLHLKSQKGAKKLGSRSVCLHCHARLKWYDNLPIISWLMLKGKCRKCHHKIGLAELLSELGTAFAFVAVGIAFNPIGHEISWAIIFIIMLIFTTIIIFLAIYDGLYGQLPTKFLILANVVACISLDVIIIHLGSDAPFLPTYVLYPIASVLILGGLYLILYLVSKGKWVGDGDWILGTAIGLALPVPQLALVILFLSNLLACFIMLPSVIKHKRHKIYFGPFMVAGFVITLAILPLLTQIFI